MSTTCPKTISVGIVGAGSITRRSHLPVLTQIPHVNVAWLFDSRSDVARRLARSYGVLAVDGDVRSLPPCDVVLLAIPVDARDTYLREFSERRTGVFCEKPFALTAAAHSEIIRNFPASAVGVGYMRRMFGSSMLLRRLVRDRTFGNLRRIDLREGNRSRGSGADASFLDDPRLSASSGVLVDLGSHGIDLALFATGASAFQVGHCQREVDGGVDRRVQAQMLLTGTSPDYAEAVEFNFCVSWLDRQSNRISLMFDNAIVWVQLGPGAVVYVGDPDKSADCFALSLESGGARTYNQAFFLEWQSFLQGWRTGAESEVSGQSALLTTSLVEALLCAPAAAA